MTDHKATPEQWADVGAFASDTRACILELRARIEQLETLKQDKLDRLIAQDRDDAPAPTDSLVEQVADGISKPLQLTPEQAQQISDLLAPNSKSTPNPSQIGSSLVERVRKALSYPPEPYARAAIREVAAWAKQQGLQRTARKLREEAER